ncbi:MAG: alpha/beta hydrolase fold domain-containing protein [Clostridium sp.]
MKRKFLFIFSVFIIILLSCGFIFRNKISFLYNLATTYIDVYSEEFNIDKHSNPIEDVTFKDINYKSRKGNDLKLDIYSPIKKKYKKSPVILYVHGGGWIYGNKDIPEFLSPLLNVFREEGFTIISTSYELLNKSIDFEEQVSDVKDTLRWINKYSDTYDLDVNEIGVIGVSSGAHLSLLACYSNKNSFAGDLSLEGFNSNVKYIIDLFGPTNLFTLNTELATWDMQQILSNIENKESYFNKYNPINYLKENLPNILIVHSLTDAVVPYDNASVLYDGNITFNNDATLVTLNTASHDMNNITKEDFRECILSLIKFIIKNTPL